MGEFLLQNLVLRWQKKKKAVQKFFHAYWKKKVLVFLYIFVNNILLAIISKHNMASNKNKGYNMRRMNDLWSFYNSTLLGVDVFTEKEYILHFWWVFCSIIVNTGSVKWLYNMSNLNYKYFHYIHKTHPCFFFFYALMIWGIFVSIFLSFLPSSHPLFISFSRLKA